jgi:AcrR family transcriptional regulator
VASVSYSLSRKMSQVPTKQHQDQPVLSRSPTPRERARTETLARVKTIALRQLADGGVGAISLKAIALEVGITGPAIYRYIASRNELLTELIIDAYDDLAAALDSVARARTADPWQVQVNALADAYRAWAVEQPHRYRLLFSAPLPGYDANAQRLVEAADRSMAVFLNVYARAGVEGDVRPPLGKTLTKQLRAWAVTRSRDPGTPETLYQGVITWTRLHGFVSLEIEGAFASMGIDPDSVFHREVDALTAR